MTAALIRVRNNTTHEICLPPLDPMDQYGAFRLAPGEWDAPGAVLEPLLSGDKPGHRRFRELYLSPRDGSRPMIEVLDGALVGQRQGPPPPKTLGDYGEAAAVVFAREEDDVVALKRWVHDKRPAVAAAAAARLAELGGR